MPQSTLYIVANLLIALSLVSISAAAAWALLKHRAKFPSVNIVFTVFCLVLGASRSMKALRNVSDFSALELALDVAAAACAVSSAIIIWPLTLRLQKLPSYLELESAYRKLDATRDALQHSQKMFESFMNTIPAISYIRDAQGKFIYCNRLLHTLLGVPVETIVGSFDLPIVQDELNERIRSSDIEVIKTNRQQEAVEQYLDADGTEHDWFIVRFPIPNSGNPLCGLVAIDITAQLRLHEAQEKMAAILDASQDAIFGKDLNGIITSWNSGAEDMYGYTSEEAVGMSVKQLSPPDRLEEVERILDLTKQGKQITDLETLRIGKGGERKEVSITVSPLRDAAGNVYGAAVVARDIHKIKAAEREIRSLNEELSGRVDQLSQANAALQAARDEALEASSLKSAFVANISHELRTPLSGILGLNEILLHSGLEGEQRQLAEMVQASAESLLGVVNDILDLSKIEAGKITLDYEPFNPVFLIQDCARLMAPTAHNKGLEYMLEMDQQIPEMVFGDSARVRQVLLNLIGNAIKFTETGAVRVTVRAQELGEDQVAIRFMVSDTGIGIAQDQLKYLFTPFSQVDRSTTRRFGGTGLGLAISKQFVAMMGGRIGVDSIPGQGSSFWFSIPFDRKKLQNHGSLEQRREAVAAAEPIATEVTSGKRVLVVEDNAVLQQLALRQLNNLGVEAASAIFGREAIPLAVSGDFDLVLMDVNLPDITGLEATEAIRDIEKSARKIPIPIVAMTAGAMKGDRERALESGMNDYISKPVSAQQLKRVVEYWLRRAPVRRAS